MKNKIVSWYRFLLIILSAIMLVTVIVILNSLRTDEPHLIELFHANIRNTIYIGSFLFFVIVATVYFYLPVHLKRALSHISTVVDDFKKSIYDTDYGLEDKEKILDKEVFAVLNQLIDTRKEIKKNSMGRKAKVYEHYSRITVLMRLVTEGVLIADIKGNIIFINDTLMETFQQLKPETNILTTSYPLEIENNIKKIVMESLKQKKRMEPYQCFIPNLKRHINIDSALVRNEDGAVTGIVLVIQNLDKRKTERKPEKEPERNEG
ncbi:MAG: hypothetical protein K9M99_11285 [Candidatus Cloacimonetes bacterium]|nr:hypothetical protein [Candidatus Cloacimonadota bacterium]